MADRGAPPEFLTAFFGKFFQGYFDMYATQEDAIRDAFASLRPQHQAQLRDYLENALPGDDGTTAYRANKKSNSGYAFGGAKATKRFLEEVAATLCGTQK